MSDPKIKYSAYFNALKNNYLFSEVRRKAAAFKDKNGGEITDLGVGDIAYPLPEIIVEALVAASREMGDNARFRGYSPEGGYDFLKEKIINYYEKKGIRPEGGEVFVGNGAKSDVSGFTYILGPCDELITDPVYPVYADAAVMRGNRIEFLKGNKDNGFLPLPRGLKKKPRLICLCSPNNPSGGAYDRAGLKEWVDFALDTGSVILFDAAYSAFAGDGVPASIFEIDGAKDCAVEFCSFSKTAGFTGLRCSWAVVPNGIKWGEKKLNSLWKRRQSAMFNGVAYPVQRAAEAALTGDGITACKNVIKKYKENAAKVSEFLNRLGIWHTGEKHSPYIWLECPSGMNSWEFFEYMLEKYRVVGAPGCGFGSAGEGFFRISCFAKQEAIEGAVSAIAEDIGVQLR